MRITRVLLLATALLSVVFTPTADAKCPRTQDGFVACRSVCIYPNNCEAVENHSGYCYKDTVTNTCFDGDYEPCCDDPSLF